MIMRNNKQWMRSDEARKALRGSSCDLMHLREDGKLRFEKKRNACLYNGDDVGREAVRKMNVARRRGEIYGAS